MIGPLGEFHIPDAPVTTRDHVRQLSEQVFAGEYDHPELPTDGVRTAIDVGAGWGAFAVWAWKRWPGIHVSAFEPNAEAAIYFMRNAAGAFLCTAAVTVDSSPLYGVSWEWGSGHTKGRTEGTPVTAIHPRHLGPADIIKIDAEGVEAEVLEHYQFIDRARALLVEWHSPALKAECDRIIRTRTLMRCVRAESERDYGVSIWVRQ